MVARWTKLNHGWREHPADVLTTYELAIPDPTRLDVTYDEKQVQEYLSATSKGDARR